MTIDKASERYHIPAELLWEYESWGLCGGVKKVMGARRYDDRDMERLSMVMTLKNGGRSQRTGGIFLMVGQHRKCRKLY
ncbi:MAG: MerR family transcriptional regulator [Anaerovoracaceae bacterium]